MARLSLMRIAEIMNAEGKSEYISVAEGMHMDGVYGAFPYIEVSSVSGIRFSVEPFRGLDISSLSYRGVDIAYMAPAGVRHPDVFDYSADSFEGNMFFGMLTTCGLENAGPSCTDDEGIYYSKHGSLDYSIADGIHISFSEDGKRLLIEGAVMDCRFSMHHFVFKRRIMFSADDCLIGIEDKVDNPGEADQICLMYHYNFGAPFLSPCCRLSIPYASAVPKNAAAAKEAESILSVKEPSPANEPHVFYMSFPEEAMHKVSIFNPELGIDAELSFSGDTLPCMDLWKCLRPERFVMAFEPCNAFPYGRTMQRVKGNADYMENSESRIFRSCLQIKGGNDE